jgi:hypothetical protein
LLLFDSCNTLCKAKTKVIMFLPLLNVVWAL